MRILSLCLSPAFGGLEMYTHRAMRWLHERGHLNLAVVRPATPFEQWVRRDGFDYRGLCAQRAWPLLTARTLAKVIDQAGIDALHMNWGDDLKLAVLAKRLSKNRPPLVYSRHMRIPKSKRDPYHRWIYRQVDRLIVTTREMYAQATDHLPISPDRVHHLYLGVAPPASVARDERARFLTQAGLHSNRFTIGLFGRVEHAKGQHVLVEAVARLVSSGCDLQAVIVGQAMHPNYYHSLEEHIVSSRLQDRIRLQGFLADAKRYMCCCDVVVLASYCEHFGLVLIEAMHTGVAVIGTAAGGVPEIITDGETGLLCKPGSADDLADRIKQLYHDPDSRKSIAERGRAHAGKMFSEARHFEALCDHFEQVISAPHNRRSC